MPRSELGQKDALIDGKITVRAVVIASILAMVVLDPKSVEHANGRPAALAGALCAFLAWYALRHLRGDNLTPKHLRFLALCLFAPAATAIWTLPGGAATEAARTPADLAWKILLTLCAALVSRYGAKRLNHYLYAYDAINRKDAWEVLDFLLAAGLVCFLVVGDRIGELPWYHKLTMTPLAIMFCLAALGILKTHGRNAVRSG